jgi:hypothetical protein
MNMELLQAAAEIVGGTRELADSLGISESLLSKFMAGVVDLPDPLLLRAVDIVLEHRHSRLALSVGKHPMPERKESCKDPARGKCATAGGGSERGVA